jgi:hypothetical protein
VDEIRFTERKLRIEWIELGERVCRAMKPRILKPYLTRTHHHRLMPCDVCGEVVLSARVRPCVMTPRCGKPMSEGGKGGRHRSPHVVM